MSYSDFGLDITKKALDPGVKHRDLWCLWCNNMQVKNGFYLCFSNWVICLDCVNKSYDQDMHRWENGECYKCGNKEDCYPSHPDNKGMTIHLCMDCLAWAHEVLTNSNSQNMAKKKKSLSDLINSESDVATIQAMHHVQNLPLTEIYPSDSNPRKSMDEDGIIDLAKSMEDVGLLQPITVRPDDKGQFEIVAGHRRHRAAQLLRWDTIPAIIRHVGDEEMLEIQIIENLQREDVSPMDEAAAFQSILKRESYDWLCSRIHKSKKYITDRLKLNDLVENAREYVHKGILPLTHAIMISKLPQEEQVKCIDKCIEDDWNNDAEICTLTIAKLREFIEDDLMIDLDRACFDLEDPELMPAAGACSACPKRTGNQNLLFQEITDEDKCTDAACYRDKEQAHVTATLKNAKEEFGKQSVCTGQTDGYSTDTIKVKGVSVAFSEKKSKGKDQVCVVLTKTNGFHNNSKLGKKVWVDREAIEGKIKDKEEKKTSGANRPGVSYEERKKEEFKTIIYPRLLKIADLLEQDTINNAEAIAIAYLKDRFDTENDRDLIALAAVLGLHPIGGSPEILWNADDEVYWPEKMKIIDKIITHIQGKGLSAICSVLSLLSSIDDTGDVRTDKEIDLEENGKLNWNEQMAFIEGNAKPAKKSAKKAASK